MNARQLLSSSVAECNARSQPITASCSDFGTIQCAVDAISGGTDDACLVGGRLSDEVREAAIKRAGASLERHMLLRENALFEYDVTGDLGAKGEADRQRILATEAMRLQAELIRGRSPEVVARMEQELGIA